MKYFLFAFALMMCSIPALSSESVRLKDIGKVEGWRENHLIGFGIVTGLAGTGDSPRSKATRQSVANFMSNFDVLVASDQVNSRNVAIVSIMALLPPVTHRGDKVDVTVTSMGDARSLLGGTLLMAPLKGPDGKVYVLAQGPVSVGGYKYDQLGNVAQKNHPTAGVISGGGQAEQDVTALPLHEDGSLAFVLNNPDYVTAERAEREINRVLGGTFASIKDSSSIHVQMPKHYEQRQSDFISLLETVEVVPDTRAKVVVNEKTGTVVTGGDVRLSKVTVAHGDLKVSIRNSFSVSQPQFIGRAGANVRTQVIPNTQISLNEEQGDMVELPESSSVSDLIRALRKIKASTRDTITILQGIKAAGALHADLIIQ
ncbi:flagellar basal-body P-ring protein [Methylophilaceae bacterium 11]|nr:flagellar basal-body P-ring protein [Methylophilaceae bacterium 11]